MLALLPSPFPDGNIVPYEYILVNTLLGSLDGIETGIRQLIRSAPLETEKWFIRV
jgi:hypothetical protein